MDMTATYISNIFVLSAAICIGEQLFRFCLALSELKWKSEHYPHRNRIPSIFTYCFDQSWCITTLSVICCAVALICDKVLLWKVTIWSLPMYFLIRGINYHQISLIDAVHWVRQGTGLDFATGMAYNYFHGYINLQFVGGKGIPGIEERLLKYEDEHKVYIPIKKLFVLVPESLRSSPVFSDPPKLEVADSIETVCLDRAGHKGRVYTCSVYRMIDEETGQPWYAAIDGAAPLQAFYESFKYSFTSSRLMEKMKHEIGVQFYQTLKKIAASDTRPPVFEPILYNDITEKDNLPHISDLVKTRIRQLKREMIT